MSTTKQHPSLRFQNGEVTDFYTAMDVYVAQYETELREGRELYREYAKEHDQPFRETWQQDLVKQSAGVAHIRDMAEEARAIYREIVGEAHKRAAEKMREKHDSILHEIADALEHGNYDSLAL